MSENKYHIWKSDSKLSPIEGTDIILKAPSLRWAMNHIATEEGVEINTRRLSVRLPSGDIWIGTKL